MAPKSWQEVILGDLVDIKHGFAFQGEYIRDSPPGEILLTPGNVAIGGGFKDDKVKYYAGDVPSDYVLNERDLIVTMTDLSKNGDTLGFPAQIPRPSNGRYLHNQRIGKVIPRPNAPIDLDFLYFLLRTDPYRNEVLASATGTTVRHTSPDRIRSFRFLLPSLGEQRAIAAILGALDDKIELNRRMNRTLEAMAQALFQSWFVDFDPVRAKMAGRQPAGMDAETAALFPSSFTDDADSLPMGWHLGTLADIAHIKMGQSPPGETYNEVGLGLPFYQGARDFGSRFPSRRVFCTVPTRLSEKGDVLLSVRAPVGMLNVAIERCAIGRGVAALQSKTKPVAFLYYSTVATRDGWDRFEANGTVFGAASRADVESFAVTVPPFEIRQRFSESVLPYESQIEINERQIASLAATRDALLPKLLSGELCVPMAKELVKDAC